MYRSIPFNQTRKLLCILIGGWGLVACDQKLSEPAAWDLPNGYYTQNSDEWQRLAELRHICGGLFHMCWYADPKTGENVFPETEFEAATYFNEGLAAVQIDGKWGYIDHQGGVVIEPRYDAPGPFLGGLAEIVVAGRVGLIDRNGNTIIEPKYEAATNLANGMIVIRQPMESKISGMAHRRRSNISLAFSRFYPREIYRGQFYDLNRGTISDEKYTFKFLKDRPQAMQQADPGLLWAKPSDGDLYGLMDTKKKWKIKPTIKSVWPFGLENDYTKIIDKNDQYGIVDYSGNWLVRPQEAKIGELYNGYFTVQHKEVYGLINMRGKLVGNRYFEKVDSGSANWPARVKESGEWFTLTQKEKLIPDKRKETWMLQCPDGLSVRFKGDGIEYVRKDGAAVDGTIFDLHYFSDDNCQYPFFATLGSKMGRITRQGEFLNIHGDQTWQDSSGRPVKMNFGNWIDADQAPRPAISRGQQSAELQCSGGTKRVKNNGKWGIIDSEKRMIVPAKHRAVSCFNYGVAWATNDEISKWCRIGRDGEFIANGTCRTKVYPYHKHHETHAEMHPDPYESSVLWYTAYLDFLNGDAKEPPKATRD